MSDYPDHFVENARLVILKYLYEDTGNTGNDSLIQRHLETFGIRRSRDFARTQMLALRDLGAVKVVEAGTALIATLTRAGMDHVERRSVIAGVQRPSLGN